MKKILLMLLVVCMCTVMFASCSGNIDYSEDPIALANLLDNKDRSVDVVADKDSIDSFAKSFDVRGNGVSCVIRISNSEDNEDSGIFVYCQEDTDAEIMFKDLEQYIETKIDELEDMLEEYESSALNNSIVIKEIEEQQELYEKMMVGRYNELVFIGFEALWNEVPKKSGGLSGLFS